jgi:mono/diheme cytochrome c family protein
MRASLIALLCMAVGGACGSSSSKADASSPDAKAADAATPDAGPSAAVLRGKYLVNNVFACVDCHSPRHADGSFIDGQALSGVECLFDIVPNDDTMGCVSSRNLTNDVTGLKNFTDDQIKQMFMNGLLPTGKALFPIMPYWALHNLTADDASAIVAYLRTVPAVSHTVPANQPPAADIPGPATPINFDTEVPKPTGVTGATLDSANRGRYIAGIICIDCHTPDNAPGNPKPKDLTKAFQGGADFGPIPGVGDHIFSQNITPDVATGIGGLTVDQIVKELKMGLDRNNKLICPPMPVGPMGAFGGLTDDDAKDIANYILNIPPKTSQIAQCVFIPPG